MNGRVKKNMLTLSMLLYGCLCSCSHVQCSINREFAILFCSPWDLNKMMFEYIFPLDPGCHLNPIYLILNSESKNVVEKIWRNSMWKYFLLIWKLFFVCRFQFFDMQTTISKEKAISEQAIAVTSNKHQRLLILDIFFYHFFVVSYVGNYYRNLHKYCGNALHACEPRAKTHRTRLIR